MNNSDLQTVDDPWWSICFPSLVFIISCFPFNISDNDQMYALLDDLDNCLESEKMKIKISSFFLLFFLPVFVIVDKIGLFNLYLFGSLFGK